MAVESWFPARWSGDTKPPRSRSCPTNSNGDSQSKSSATSLPSCFHSNEMTPHDLTRTPATDPIEIYRYRDGLYAVDMLTAALTGLDLFTFIGERRLSKRDLCEGLEIQDRPTDVMLTLFTAMGLLEYDNGV